jgi:hypothetical protein
MNRGAYWAGSPLPSGEAENANSDETGAFALPHAEPLGISLTDLDDEPLAPPSTTTAEKIALGLLGLIAFLWIAAMIGMALSAFADRTLTPIDAMRGISLACGPLALIVAILILWQRNSAREGRRFADVARAVRMESLALDAVLGLTSKRLAEDRIAVADQADRLLLLADQTSLKLREATDEIAREIAELGQRSKELDSAAGTARIDRRNDSFNGGRRARAGRRARRSAHRTRVSRARRGGRCRRCSQPLIRAAFAYRRRQRDRGARDRGRIAADDRVGRRRARARHRSR